MNLHLENDLAAYDAGEHGKEIADWVENDQRFIDYVISANKSPIPESPDTPYRPTDEWLEAQNFHPNDLIYEAAESLDWYSTPDSLCLYLNFQKIEGKL